MSHSPGMQQTQHHPLDITKIKKNIYIYIFFKKNEERFADGNYAPSTSAARGLQQRWL